MPNLSVRYVRLEGKKKDIPPEQLKRATIKEIESIKADLIIYTDGSTSGQQENGGAGFSVQTNTGEVIEELSYPAGE